MESSPADSNANKHVDTLPAPATPRPRGFAAMDPESRRRLGSKGGKTAHERGTANKFTPETASVAGRKGGSALRRRRRLESAAQQSPTP